MAIPVPVYHFPISAKVHPSRTLWDGDGMGAGKGRHKMDRTKLTFREQTTWRGQSSGTEDLNYISDGKVSSFRRPILLKVRDDSF